MLPLIVVVGALAAGVGVHLLGRQQPGAAAPAAKARVATKPRGYSGHKGPPSVMDAVPDGVRAPEIQLLGVVHRLSVRELFWWRIIQGSGGIHVAMDRQEPAILAEIVGDRPRLTFTAAFFVLELTQGVALLKTTLADLERQCQFP